MSHRRFGRKVEPAKVVAYRTSKPSTKEKTRSDNRARAKIEVETARDEIVEEGDFIGPLLVAVFDPHLHMPPDILHVFLLGVVKYAWKATLDVDTLKNGRPGHSTLRAILASMSSVGLSGKIAVDHLVDYPGSLVGYDFVVLAQVAPLVSQLLFDHSQARSNLERHIKRAVPDKDLLWPTVRKWYKTMGVPISADHMCRWSVLWQAMKGGERDSSTNSFAMKVLDFTMALAEAAAVASMAGKYVVDGSFDQQAFISARLAKAMRRHDVTKRSRPSGQEHVVQRSCSEVVDDEDNEVSFTSLIKEALKPEGSKRKSKKAKRQEKADD